MKPKICGVCLKEVPALWKAKRKLPDGTIIPGECKSCAAKSKSLIAPIIDLIQEMDILILKQNKASQSTKKSTTIPKQSEKEKKRQAAYKVVRKYYLAEHPRCEALVSRGCTGSADQVHHKCGRIGDLLINMKYFLATCDSCHKWIELNPKKAKILGLSLNRLDK